MITLLDNERSGLDTLQEDSQRLRLAPQLLVQNKGLLKMI